MPLKDGVYNIRNVGRQLMLDLRENRPDESNNIIGWVENGNVAQQWIVRSQGDNIYSIQSNNAGIHGHGFFAADKLDDDEQIRYTRKAWMTTLSHAGNNEYKISFTRGRRGLVLAIPGKQRDVKLVNECQNPNERWIFEFIRE
ncbi:hypothetical protein AX16_007629 [Volvariella volvacea WC 439]|nr:hypothetical protein AX16_007629 [Volvariella volvacea WC 439]